MNSILPGMDPYLEDPSLWSGVHAAVIVYIRDRLQPLIRPRYVAAIEERVYVEGPDRSIQPDVTARRSRRDLPPSRAMILEADEPLRVSAPSEPTHETFIEILDRKDGQRVVAMIEVLSPANKVPGPGRESYRRKQREVLSGAAHLIEIDLLRKGDHASAVPEHEARSRADYDYLACVNRAEGDRSEYELYPRKLRDRLPRIRIPLAGDDPDTVLDLQAVLEQAYDSGAYIDRIDYARPCVPPLPAIDQAWADEWIRKAGEPT